MVTVLGVTPLIYVCVCVCACVHACVRVCVLIFNGEKKDAVSLVFLVRVA